MTLRTSLCGALVGALWMTLQPGALSPCGAAEVAAAITYDFIPRPSGLADAFRPSGDTSLKFLTIKTIDGYPMEAALWLPNGKAAADTTIRGKKEALDAIKRDGARAAENTPPPQPLALPEDLRPPATRPGATSPGTTTTHPSN